MKILEYNRDAARQVFEKWCKDRGTLQPLIDDYAVVRNELQLSYNKSCEEAKDDIRKDYCKDVCFGIYIYEYLTKQKWFTLSIASNDGFWRYLSVSVIPDIVSDRWGMSNVNYFWKKSNRLWPKSIWWFIHLSYIDSIESTKKTL